MSMSELAAQIVPGDRGASPKAPFRVARISSIDLTDVPPMAEVGEGDNLRLVRVGGNVWDYQPGDMVAYLETGGGALIICKVPIVGIGNPLGPTGDPDDSEPLEAWHQVGAAGEPAFENSWVNYGAPYANASFYMQPDGWVRLQGVVKSGTNTATIFTLPEEYQPGLTTTHNIIHNALVSLVTIDGDGTVKNTLGGSNVYVSLDGITFPSRRNIPGLTPGITANNWAYEPGRPALFYVRDDGWVWISGRLNNGTAGVMVQPPENARITDNWLLYPVVTGLGFGIANVRHDGLRHASGVSLTGTQVGGTNYFGHRSEQVAIWDTPSFTNGWANFGSTWEAVTYYKDHFGVVHLRGLATGAAKTSNLMFTLPVGYRPLAQHVYLSAIGGDIIGRVDVRADGVVEAITSNTGYCSLANMSFRAEQ